MSAMGRFQTFTNVRFRPTAVIRGIRLKRSSEVEYQRVHLPVAELCSIGLLGLIDTCSHRCFPVADNSRSPTSTSSAAT